MCAFLPEQSLFFFPVPLSLALSFPLFLPPIFLKSLYLNLSLSLLFRNSSRKCSLLCYTCWGNSSLNLTLVSCYSSDDAREFILKKRQTQNNRFASQHSSLKIDLSEQSQVTEFTPEWKRKSLQQCHRIFFFLLKSLDAILSTLDVDFFCFLLPKPFHTSPALIPGTEECL